MYETTSTEYPYNRTVLVRVLVSLGRAGRTRQDLPGQDVAQDESRKGRKGYCREGVQYPGYCTVP